MNQLNIYSYGILKGTILESCPFLLYNNDLILTKTKEIMLSFANDTALLTERKPEKKSEKIAKQVWEWYMVK